MSRLSGNEQAHARPSRAPLQQQQQAQQGCLPQHSAASASPACCLQYHPKRGAPGHAGRRAAAAGWLRSPLRWQRAARTGDRPGRRGSRTASAPPAEPPALGSAQAAPGLRDPPLRRQPAPRPRQAAHCRQAQRTEASNRTVRHRWHQRCRAAAAAAAAALSRLRIFMRMFACASATRRAQCTARNDPPDLRCHLLHRYLAGQVGLGQGDKGGDAQGNGHSQVLPSHPGQPCRSG